ncbi:MAG: cobyric acid synthase [Clostridiales bacterium]|nr:cobyric acid synthase [Clostridiales bacterium]
MAKSIMVQGTMSSAGKSFIVAGLCRIFKQDGYRVAPFKSQNMALNSFITEEGLEMGRAQVMQAEAAGRTPSVYMNPILLKPTNDTGSQVIVNGKVRGNMAARDYFRYKTSLIPDVMHAYEKLSEDTDIIVIEGAGSPAEINLKEQDIVNMGMAKMADAPVLLVGDIDRGGVFAQLYGTYALLEPEEQKRVRGFVINKFRGDKTILDPGIDMLQERIPVPVLGVVPYMDVKVEDEDSLTERFSRKEKAGIDLAVIRFPRISNFTDFSVFEQMDNVSLRYVTSVRELGSPDMIFLPGSKNTMGDLKWMRQNGLEAAIKKRAGDIPVFGICGGYQMLGNTLSDPLGVEDGGNLRGMELLPMDTVMREEKHTTQVEGRIGQPDGIFSVLAGQEIRGYEIHMGESTAKGYAGSLCRIRKTGAGEETAGAETADGLFANEVYGTYVHGIFDQGKIAWMMVQALAKKKNLEISSGEWMDYAAFKETQYDKMADILRQHMDMEAIYGLINGR